jgi:hypothetical protein
MKRGAEITIVSQRVVRRRIDRLIKEIDRESIRGIVVTRLRKNKEKKS